MTRIRAIKPEFWSSPSLPADPWARLLFIAMWNWADDHGVGTAHPRELLGFAFPNDEQLTLDDFRRMLVEIHRVFDVKFYMVAGRPYYSIPSWHRHQKFDRRSQSRYPGPDEADVCLYEDDECDTRGIPPSTRGIPPSTRGIPPSTRGIPPSTRREFLDPPEGAQNDRDTIHSSEKTSEDETNKFDDPNFSVSDVEVDIMSNGVQQKASHQHECDTRGIPPSTRGIPPSTRGIPPSTRGIPPSTRRDVVVGSRNIGTRNIGTRNVGKVALAGGGAGGEPANVPVAATAAPGARGTRLPDNFQPDPDTITAMHRRFPAVDLTVEHEKFTNYWRAQPGAKGRKADWPATWRNWIIKAAEQTRAGPNDDNHRLRGAELKAAQFQALKDQP